VLSACYSLEHGCFDQLSTSDTDLANLRGFLFIKLLTLFPNEWTKIAVELKVCCLLFVVRCSLFTVHCSLFVVCCSLFVVCHFDKLSKSDADLR